MENNINKGGIFQMTQTTGENFGKRKTPPKAPTYCRYFQKILQTIYSQNIVNTIATSSNHGI